MAAAEHAGTEAGAWKGQLERVQAELASVRADLTGTMAAARAEAAAAAKEAAVAMDAVRAELTTAASAARLAEQRLVDAQAAEGRERTARERLEERAAALVERASRAEAELAPTTRPSPVPMAAA